MRVQEGLPGAFLFKAFVPGTDIIVDHGDVAVSAAILMRASKGSVGNIIDKAGIIQFPGERHSPAHIPLNWPQVGGQFIAHAPGNDGRMMAMDVNHLLELLTHHGPQFVRVTLRLFAPIRNFLLHQQPVPVAPIIDPVVLLPVEACQNAVACFEQTQHLFQIVL